MQACFTTAGVNGTSISQAAADWYSRVMCSSSRKMAVRPSWRR